MLLESLAPFIGPIENIIYGDERDSKENNMRVFALADTTSEVAAELQAKGRRLKDLLSEWGIASPTVLDLEEAY